MANLLRFLKQHGNKNFKTLKLQEADFLVFAYLSYANFEDIDLVKNIEKKFSSVDFLDLNNEEILSHINKNFLVPKEFLRVYKLIHDSKRYHDLKITYLENVIDDNKEMQFYGITFVIHNYCFIIFRGTDRKFIGWKEDLNMLIKDKIPSEGYAYTYAKNVIDHFDDKKIYLIGHSKGGYLSYSSFFRLDESYKDKIKRVINLDGPSFKNDIYDYQKYDEKLVKIVPNDCVIGTVFDHKRRYKIALTNKRALYAHNVFSWQLTKESEYTKLKYVDKLTTGSEVLSYCYRYFFKNIDEKSKKVIIDFIFDIIYIDKSDDILNVARLVKIISPKYLKGMVDAPKDVKDTVIINVKKFIKLYFYVRLNLKKIRQLDMEGKLDNEIHFSN